MLRADANCSLGSLLRSFRNNKITNTDCECGEGKQEVEHVLFNCKNEEIILICDNFEEGYCKYVKNFKPNQWAQKLWRSRMSCLGDISVSVYYLNKPFTTHWTRGEYWGLGVFLLQYSHLPIYENYCIIIAKTRI